MMIGMALFWGAIILGFAWLVRSGTSDGRQRSEETALGILDRRFAAGDASLVEYHERRNTLQGTTGRFSPSVGTPAIEGRS